MLPYVFVLVACAICWAVLLGAYTADEL